MVIFTYGKCDSGEGSLRIDFLFAAVRAHGGAL